LGGATILMVASLFAGSTGSFGICTLTLQRMDTTASPSEWNSIGEDGHGHGLWTVCVHRVSRVAARS
jgi:hypothetical protein